MRRAGKLDRGHLVERPRPPLGRERGARQRAVQVEGHAARGERAVEREPVDAAPADARLAQGDRERPAQRLQRRALEVEPEVAGDVGRQRRVAGDRRRVEPLERALGAVADRAVGVARELAVEVDRGLVERAHERGRQQVAVGVGTEAEAGVAVERDAGERPDVLQGERGRLDGGVEDRQRAVAGEHELGGAGELRPGPAGDDQVAEPEVLLREPARGRRVDRAAVERGERPERDAVDGARQAVALLAEVADDRAQVGDRVDRVAPVGPVPVDLGEPAPERDLLQQDRERARLLVAGRLEQAGHVERAVGPLADEDARAADVEPAGRERPAQERPEVVVDHHRVDGDHGLAVAADLQARQPGARQEVAVEPSDLDLGVVGEQVRDLRHHQVARERPPGVGLQEHEHAHHEEHDHGRQPQRDLGGEPAPVAARVALGRAVLGRSASGRALGRRAAGGPPGGAARVGRRAVAGGRGVGGGVGRHEAVNAGGRRKVYGETGTC